MNEKESMPHILPRIVFVRTFCIAFIALCMIFAALLAFEPSIYFNETVVEFVGNETNSAALTQTGSTRNSLLNNASEVQIIESPELQRRVVEDLKLDAVWGKRYNGGRPLSLGECIKMLNTRISLNTRADVPTITIRVYSDVPIEAAEIANSIAQNYRNNFTEPRYVSSKILKSAEPPGKVTHASLIFKIPKDIIGSLIFALIAAGVAWGIAVARTKISHASPPVRSEKNGLRRFEKY